MTTLIIGRFLQLSDAEVASRDLWREGFLKEDMCLLYVNPHGQHALHALGGDTDESPGAHKAHSGAMTGAASGLGAGTLVGVATIPILGPVGPVLGAAVGAYAGTLVGALNKLDEDETHEPGVPPPREPGVLLAVATSSSAQRETAIEILRGQAIAMEEDEGTLRNGDWVDFNPLKSGNPIM